MSDVKRATCTNVDHCRVLVVVPAYNESTSIAGVLTDVRACEPKWSIVVVDDGSTDNTADAVRRVDEVDLIRLPCNLGIGGARQVGFVFAWRHGYDIVVQIDGDGQHMACEARRIVRTLFETDADIVIGSRYIEREGFQSSKARRLGGRIFGTALRMIYGVRVTDPTSGLRVCGPEAIKLFAESYPVDYPEIESIGMAALADLKVVEAPVRMAERTGGKSSIGFIGSAYYCLRVFMALAFCHALVGGSAGNKRK